MKIFLYSDLHISKNSSILPNSSENNNYTYRQNMIVKTGEYLASIIKKENPDLIINLGDTFDQHTITSYDVKIASEFFKCFNSINIPHFVLVGNHEMVNYDYNAIEILNNIDNITVIDKPISTNLIMNHEQECRLAFMPYMEYKDIMEFPDGDYLFSHLDIMGMSIRGNYELPDGVNIEQLQKYKIVFNGHIHKPSIKQNIVNVGSITTHSFADDDKSVPQCYVFDTQTADLNTYKSTICPLFRKCMVNSDILELNTYLNNLDTQYKYVLQVTVPYELKDAAKQIVKDDNKIIASRFSVIFSNKTEQNDISNEIVDTCNIDIKKAFGDFINVTQDLKYSKDLYNKIIERIDINGK